MTEKQALEFLEYLQTLGSVPGLDTIKELLKRLDNPQDQLSFVHIAGTNGKGSVALLVSETLKNAGYQVGRYISPTISDYRERFSVNGKMITKKDLYRLLAQLKSVCEEMVKDGFAHPTAFEVETALSFLYDIEKKCDLVVLECGMGGFMDATNVVKNTLVCVFASISMDHMSFLGNTLGKIATQKSGIIKEGADIVCYPSKEEALNQILKEAKEKNIPDENICITDENLIKDKKYGLLKQKMSYKSYRKLTLSLAGKHQLINAAVALDTIEALKRKGYDIPKESVMDAFSQATWPGRMEIIQKKPLMIMDGAHNEDAAKKLAASIEEYFLGKRLIYIMGVFQDKEYEKIIDLTCRYASQIITIKTPNNPRALSAYELAQAVARVNPNVTNVDSLEEAVEISSLFADKDSVILVFGSLSFLGELKNIVQKKEKKK